MGKPFVAFSILLTFLITVVRADDNEALVTVDTFVSNYHCKPAPERVPELLDLLLKKKVLENPLVASAGSRPSISHAFGYMARGNPKLVRLYESRFVSTDKLGREFLLGALLICADDATAHFWRCGHRILNIAIRKRG